MRPLRAGSVCTGYSGLDMAVLGVFGGELAWVADNDPGAAQILDHRHPGVKNLGDITKVDWATVERVDILCGGFPCQDLSYAGLGAGIQEGNRSGIWYTIAYAIGVLRPRIVVLENVAAIVGRRPGLDVVICSLAALGYSLAGDCVRAADIGAPHIRDRWFALAWRDDEDPDLELGEQRGEPARGETAGGRARADAGRPGRALAGSAAVAAGPGDRRGRVGDQAAGPDGTAGGPVQPGPGPGPVQGAEVAGRAPVEPGRRGRRGGGPVTVAGGHADVAGPDDLVLAADSRGVESWPAGGERGTTGTDRRPGDYGQGNNVPADPGGGGVQRRGDDGVVAGPASPAEGQGLQPERDGHTADDRGPGDERCPGCGDLIGDHDSGGFCAGDCGGNCPGPQWGRPGGGWNDFEDDADPADVRDYALQWGEFAPAIQRWEFLTGRPAPAPTDMGRTGPRLSPRFVEWMMGLPPGWVTDVPGLSRSAQLKALGNGVVPQQAVAALYLLAERAREAMREAA